MFWRFSHLMSAGTGISMKIMAALSSTLMLACVKGIDGSIPIGEVIFFRSVIALIPLLCWLKLQGGVRQGIQTHNVRGHFVRGLAGTISMYLSYLSLLYISLTASRQRRRYSDRLPPETRSI